MFYFLFLKINYLNKADSSYTTSIIGLLDYSLDSICWKNPDLIYLTWMMNIKLKYTDILYPSIS